MVRTQIQLTETESEALKEAARRAGLSVAELIRRCVDRFLDEMSRSAPQQTGRYLLPIFSPNDSPFKKCRPCCYNAKEWEDPTLAKTQS